MLRVFCWMACLWAFMVELTFAGLWKKQRFSCDRGWAVWEGLSQHSLPLGTRKRGYFSISSCHLFFFFFQFFIFFILYLLSSLPSPLTHLLSIQHMSFQRQKQSFLFNQKGRAGSRYFEGNMKGWSGHSMLILDWTVAMAVLYSLSVFVLVCARACMCGRVVSSPVFLHAVPIDSDITA